MKTSLSVVMPVYNEEHLAYTSLERLRILGTSPHLERVEIIVEDCSKNDTPQIIERFRREQTPNPDWKDHWTFLCQEKNKGKGKAVQTALERARCEVSVIHDPDLEYHPKGLIRIISVLIEEQADAVYDSPYAGGAAGAPVRGLTV